MDSGVIKQLLILFVLMAAGFAAMKAKFIDKTGSDKISALISRVTMPSLYIATFMAQRFSAERMLSCGILLGFSALYYITAIACSFAFVKLTKAGGKSRGVYQFLIVFSNSAYMGFPVLRAILGEDAIFYGAFFNLPFNILAYSLGIWLLRRGGGEGGIKKREMFLNPGTVAVVFGVLLFLLSPLVENTAAYDIIYRGVVFEGLKLLGDTTIVLSMIVIGTVLASAKVGEVVRNIRALGVCFIRLLILPAIIFACLLPLAGRVDSMIIKIPVLVAAMPCAVFSVILAKEYGGDEKLASVGVFLSTLLSAATIPLVAAALRWAM